MTKIVPVLSPAVIDQLSFIQALAGQVPIEKGSYPSSTCTTFRGVQPARNTTSYVSNTKAHRWLIASTLTYCFSQHSVPTYVYGLFSRTSHLTLISNQ